MRPATCGDGRGAQTQPGAGRGCRRLGHRPAAGRTGTASDLDVPHGASSEPFSAAVLDPLRRWHSMPRKVRRCSRPSTANASSAPPRRPCMPRCSTRVATSARCARCTDYWRSMAAVASGATSSPIRPAPTPDLLAIAPNQIWSWDFHVTQGTSQVDLLPPVRHPGHVQPPCRLTGATRQIVVGWATLSVDIKHTDRIPTSPGGTPPGNKPCRTGDTHS